MSKTYWPNGKRMIVSISMQLETGGQPNTAEGPLENSALPKDMPNFSNDSWYNYGGVEGVPRMLRLWKKHNIKVTSHVVGSAAEKFPEVAKAIADEGHEIAAHGMSWDIQWKLSYEKEKKFIKDGLDAVEKITGKRGKGFNAYWMQRSKNTLKILQELGFLYHIDDVSRDEPSISMVNNKKFVIIPYSLRNNDIVNMTKKYWTPKMHLEQLKLDFDQLYKESKHRRVMMSFSAHDRISGQPSMISVLDEFINYVKGHEGIEFMRKDEIAKMIIDDPNTPINTFEDKYNN